MPEGELLMFDVRLSAEFSLVFGEVDESRELNLTFRGRK